MRIVRNRKNSEMYNKNEFPRQNDGSLNKKRTFGNLRVVINFREKDP